jgi:hypothetical protein
VGEPLRRLTCGALIASALFGCVRPVVAPAADDPHGRPELYLQQTPPAPPSCDGAVDVVGQSELDARAHDVLSELSVTCPAGVPDDCRERLLARACEKGADAVLLDEVQLTRPEPALSGPQQRSMSGTAIAWR